MVLFRTWTGVVPVEPRHGHWCRYLVRSFLRHHRLNRLPGRPWNYQSRQPSSEGFFKAYLALSIISCLLAVAMIIFSVFVIIMSHVSCGIYSTIKVEYLRLH